MVSTLQALCNSQTFLRAFAKLLPMLWLLISRIYYRQCCMYIMNVTVYSVKMLMMITFRVSRRPQEMYCGHGRLCVCLSTAACLHYCTDLDVMWRNGRGCPLFVHYWTDLQSVHGLRCYGNTMEMCGRAQR